MVAPMRGKHAEKDALVIDRLLIERSVAEQMTAHR